MNAKEMQIDSWLLALSTWALVLDPDDITVVKSLLALDELRLCVICNRGY
jgi:hypothetical protein